jgi:glucose-6-phosphate dehydrogenase assembly protein OpcA
MATVDGSPAPDLAGFKLVRIDQVEGELAARARSAAGADHPISRTCSLNLLAYVEDAAESRIVFDLIQKVANDHPMRVIAMLLDPRVQEADVRTWVSIACADAGAGDLVCSEEIALMANPDGSARLVSAINALLSADLPIALWWRGGSPFLNRLFKGVAPLADRVVVDSKRFGDGPAALDTLQRLRGLRGGRVALADMNWHRIATWRSTLSACFDDPGVLRMLPEIDRSEIEFSTGASTEKVAPSARSLLLAGWLISRLPTIAGHGDIAGIRNAWATPGSIVALRLRSSSSRAGVSIEWKSADEGIVATALDRAGEALRRWRFSPDPEGEADLLYRCIEAQSADPLMEAALEVG